MNPIGSLASRHACVTKIQSYAGAVCGSAGRTAAVIPIDITTARITSGFFPSTNVSFAHWKVAHIMGTCLTLTDTCVESRGGLYCQTFYTLFLLEKTSMVAICSLIWNVLRSMDHAAPTVGISCQSWLRIQSSGTAKPVTVTSRIARS
jgi:hypothetical protein